MDPIMFGPIVVQFVRRAVRWRLPCIAVMLTVAVLAGGAGEAICAGAGREPPRPAPHGVLDCAAAGFLPGQLLPLAAGAEGPRRTLQWNTSAFLTPFAFSLDEIAGVRFAPRAPAPAPEGVLCLGLRGGDAISGRITAVDADAITIVPVGHGPDQPVRIERGEIVRISRRDAAGGSFIGPGGLVGWEQSPAASWQEEAGRILSTMRGAAVVRNVLAPTRARYDIVLSWNRRPEFRLAVGAAETAANDTSWVEMLSGEEGGSDLMLVRREAGVADIKPLPGPRDEARGLLRLVVFLDQTTGRMAVVVGDAAEPPVADIVLQPRPRPPSPRFRLTLTRGDICLESLRVSPWKTDAATLDESTEAVVTKRDGTHTAAAFESFDADTDDFVFRTDSGPLRLAVGDVEEIVFPALAEHALRGQPPVRAIGISGDTVTGEIVAIDGAAVWMQRAGCDRPVAMPLATLLTLRSLNTAENPTPPPGRIGRLVTADFEMRGSLVPAVTGGLAWQPTGSTNAAACAAAFAGGDAAGPTGARLEYTAARPGTRGLDSPRPGGIGGIGGMVGKDEEGFFVIAMLTEEGAAARDGRLQPGDRLVAVAPAPDKRFVETADLDAETVTNLLRGPIGLLVRLRVTGGAGGRVREIGFPRGLISVGGPELLTQALETHARLAAPPVAAAATEQFPALVVLRSGDVAACRAEASDGATLRLAVSLAADDERMCDVPGRLVKALELMPAAASRTLDPLRRDRLLTLPRMQRSRPPTHLLRLVNGDYLRGWLVGLDATVVQFEVLGTVKKLPRESVVRIIWLHADEIEGLAAEPGAKPAEDGGGNGDASPEASPESGSPESGSIVQGVWADGRRATLEPMLLDGKILSGRNPAFGEIRINLGEVDRLLFGTAIEDDAEERPFSQWRLKPALEPRALREAAGGASG